MNSRLVIATVTVTAVIAGTTGYFLASVQSSSREQGTSSTIEAKQERKILYWHDPMVPNARFDQPGKSPFMDMQLVPVYEGDEARGGVQIDARAAQNLGIRTAMVERRVLSKTLRAVGTIAVDERRIAVVQSRVPGNVIRLHVKAPLQDVRAGQPLADILAPQWLAAQQEYLSLLENKSAALDSLRAASRERLTVLGISAQTVAQIERDRKVADTTSIVTPASGVVTELLVREGSAFDAGAPLMRLADLSTVWVNAQIPEAQVFQVPEGSQVQAHATAYPGQVFAGSVIALLPEVERESRTQTARVQIDNPGRQLVPGMFIALEFAQPRSEPKLAIPSEALIVTGERSVVVRAVEDDRFEVTDVNVGAEADGFTEILSGLSEGDRIVLSGQFLIDSEASLRSAVNRLGSPSKSMPSNAAGDSTSHATTGVVKSLDDQQITLAHEAVADLNWPAMTMKFEMPDARLAKGIEPGDRVRFSFVEDGPGRYRIASLSKVPATHEESNP